MRLNHSPSPGDTVTVAYTLAIGPFKGDRFVQSGRVVEVGPDSLVYAYGPSDVLYTVETHSGHVRGRRGRLIGTDATTEVEWWEGRAGETTGGLGQ